VKVGTSHARTQDVLLASGQREPVVAEVPGGLTYLEPVDVGGSIAVVEVFIPAEALTRGVGTAWWALTAVAVGLVAASVLVGDRLAGKVVGSARTLASAAVALGDGDLDVRVRPSGPRELAEAGVAFNRMADRLMQSRTTERELVADLSHRLRTPLTVLRLDAESLVEGARSDDDARLLLETGEMFLGTPEEADRRRTIRRIRQAVASLEQEIDVLIRTTRQVVSSEEPAEQPNLCDASEVVRDRMVFWSQLADDQNRPHRVVGAHTRIQVPVPRAELAAAIDAGKEVVVIGGEAVNPRLHLLMHQVVADRLLHDDPPEDWLAFDALLERGIDAHEAQHAVGRQFVEEMLAKLGPPPPPEPRPRGHGDRRARDRRKAQRAARRRNRR
jgi:signal transduction histidine kinase